MRPRVIRAATIEGQFGTYWCPTAAAVDDRLMALRILWRDTNEVGRARIRADVDALLDRRLELTGERS